MSTKAQKIARLKNKQYREAFVGSQISVGLPFQIRALREQREWKQSRLASEAGMLQPRISAMESPGGAKFNLETLRRLAAAFDVALVVRFVPFGELVDWSEHFNPDTFSLPSFEDDPAFNDRLEEPEKVASGTIQAGSPKQLAEGYVLREQPVTWSSELDLGENVLARQTTLQELPGRSTTLTSSVIPIDKGRRNYEVTTLRIPPTSETAGLTSELIEVSRMRTPANG